MLPGCPFTEGVDTSQACHGPRSLQPVLADLNDSLQVVSVSRTHTFSAFLIQHRQTLTVQRPRVCCVNASAAAEQRVRLRPTWPFRKHLCPPVDLPLSTPVLGVVHETGDEDFPPFSSFLKSTFLWEFPSGPVVKTQCLYCQGPDSIPVWGAKILQASVTKKNQQQQREKAHFYQTHCYPIVHAPNYDCFHTEEAKREKQRSLMDAIYLNNYCALMDRGQPRLCVLTARDPDSSNHCFP